MQSVTNCICENGDGAVSTDKKTKGQRDRQSDSSIPLFNFGDQGYNKLWIAKDPACNHQWPKKHAKHCCAHCACWWSGTICYLNSKVHGANMGLIWGRQVPGGPHVGPMNFAIWVGHLQTQWQTNFGYKYVWFQLLNLKGWWSVSQGSIIKTMY